MKLEVGKTYRNRITTGLGTTRFKIQEQWGPNYFVGRAVNSTGTPIGQEYLFTATGIPLGYSGNTNTNSFPWSLVEEKKGYEYRLIYEGLVDNSWTPLTPSTPRYTYDTAKYMVRERGDNSLASLKVLSNTEFKELQRKA